MHMHLQQNSVYNLDTVRLATTKNCKTTAIYYNKSYMNEVSLFLKIFPPPPFLALRVETRASVLANVLGSLGAVVAEFVGGKGRKVRKPAPVSVLNDGEFSREVRRASVPSQKTHTAQVERTPLSPEFLLRTAKGCPRPMVSVCSFYSSLTYTSKADHTANAYVTPQNAVPPEWK